MIGPTITVHLRPYELAAAERVGSERRAGSARLGNRLGAVDGGLQGDIDGAAAELAVAKLLDRYWSASVRTPDEPAAKLPDVGELQVRSTRHDDGHLLLYADAVDDDLYVLVTGRLPDLVVRGWIDAASAKRLGRWAAGRSGVSCWWVSQTLLRPIGELVVELRRRETGQP